MLSKGVPMKENIEYEKRDLLLEAAKAEFMEKGYNKASLRSICAKAGVTTGALYFFFNSKDDLFSALVDQPLKELKNLILEHFKEDAVYMSSLKSLDELDLNHDKDTEKFVDCIYKNYESFLLLLNSSENTMYENIISEFVDLLEKQIPVMLSKANGYSIDEFMSHWMSHITIDGYVNVIKHERNKAKALPKLQEITNYLVRGWLLLVLKEK